MSARATTHRIDRLRAALLACRSPQPHPPRSVDLTVEPALPHELNLQELLRLFYGGPAQRPLSELGEFVPVTADQTPPPFRELLDHNHHMTVTVEAYHQCPVAVQVLESRHADDHYLRRILLTRTSDGKVVQFGIVRLALQAIAEPVRAEIEAEHTPLGRVLIQHRVLREVERQRLYRVQTGPELASLLHVPVGSIVYGRTALIYCDGQPAVELLEVVPPLEPR